MQSQLWKVDVYKRQVLAQYFKLTEEEIMCIRYHMGAFCDKSEWNDYTRAVHKLSLIHIEMGIRDSRETD